MEPGDRLILCSAKPSWTDVDDPDAYRNLEFVERQLVAKGVDTVLMISGDKHHYAHYTNIDDEGQSARQADGRGRWGVPVGDPPAAASRSTCPSPCSARTTRPTPCERFDLVDRRFRPNRGRSG